MSRGAARSAPLLPCRLYCCSSGVFSLFMLSNTLYDLLGVLLVFVFAIPISFLTGRSLGVGTHLVPHVRAIAGLEPLANTDARLLHPLYRRLGATNKVATSTEVRILDARCSATVP